MSPLATAADLRVLPCGPRAVLLELADAGQRRRYVAALAAADLPAVTETVPGDRTVLIRFAAASDRTELTRRLRALPLGSPVDLDSDSRPLEVPVVYDGADLDAVADALGVDPGEVVARHTGQVWTVEFAGFAPGFGYLVGDDGGLEVARRESPRTRIPAGSVALAGPYSGVYPQPSAGGWQLIGRTALAMWDADRDPPALLHPGRRVRFVESDAG